MGKLTEIQKSEIKVMISDKLGIDLEKVKDESLLKDHLGADSLDEVELVMELETMFNVQIPDEDYENAKSIADFYKIVERYIP